MIIDRKHFDISGTCVIEKVLIKTPFKYGTVFQNEACFLYMKKGESRFNSSAEKLNVFVSEGILLKCGNYFAELIRNSQNQYCEIFAIHLHIGILKELYKDEIPSFVKPNSSTWYVQKIERQDIITHFIESLDFYFQNPTLVNDDLLKLKLKELILLLLQTKNAEDIMSLFSYLFSPRQVTLKDVIQAHLFSNLSINELAVLSGRSLSTFKRDFESQYNDTPANYIKKQKLLKAAELLITTDLSVSEIGYEIGFNDISHFTKTFKQHYHLIPSEYRKGQDIV